MSNMVPQAAANNREVWAELEKYSRKLAGEGKTLYIVASSYQVKTQTSGDKVGIGTRKSPMTHWRRGFYRWQPYGSREQAKYKLTWIEPVLVKG
jgi:hypothetical protein